MAGPRTDHHVILRVVAKPLIPIIALVALYVQFHGDYSPWRSSFMRSSSGSRQR